MKKIYYVLITFIVFVAGLSFSSCSKNDDNSSTNDGKTDPSSIATADLIAYWGFENSPKDAIGQRGVASSGVTYSAGMRGEAFQGGANSYISFDLPTNDKLATMTEFTVAMWVKAPRTSDGPGCYFQLSAGNYWNGEFAIFQDNMGDNTSDSLMVKGFFQKQGVNWAGQWWNCSNPSLVADKWIHLVINYSAATSIATLYVNGGAYKFQTLSAYSLPTRYQDDPGDPEAAGHENPNGAAKLGSLNLGLTGGNAKGVIGNWANTTVFPGVDPQDWQGHFLGAIDELRIYDKALSDDEVKALYDAEVTQVN